MALATTRNVTVASKTKLATDDIHNRMTPGNVNNAINKNANITVIEKALQLKGKAEGKGKNRKLKANDNTCGSWR